MIKKIFFILFIFSSFFGPVVSVRAQTPTPESDIQKLREVIQQKVQQKLQEISSEEVINPKKAYLGTITKIEDKNLSFDSKGQKYEFIISDDATFVNLKQNKIKITDLKEGQDVLVLTLAKDEIIYAKRILIVDPSKLENKKNISLGKIADISTTTSIFVLIPVNNNSRELQMKVDSKTEIVTKDNKNLKFTDIKKGQKIVCIYTNGQNSTYPVLKIITLD
jgi:hypothetical protein